MSYNLFDLTYRVARELGIVREGTATGGSTSTIIDTVLLKDLYNDDHFNAGTAWILYDAGGAGAAPQGLTSRITDFVKTTGVVSLATTFGAAVAAGDRYALATNAFPWDTLISKINHVLEKLLVVTEDTTSLDTAADQTEYTLPSTITDQLIEVWIQGNTGDANDNQWIKCHDWYIADPARGTAKTLIFKTQPPNPYDIKLVYYAPHPMLSAYTDKLSEAINIQRVIIPAAYYCLLYKQAQKAVADPELNNKIAIFAAQADEITRAHPVRRRSGTKLATLGDIDNVAGGY